MEKKAIWDLIFKLASKNKNENQDKQAGQSDGQTSNFTKGEEARQQNYGVREKDNFISASATTPQTKKISLGINGNLVGGSFAKTYNPFASPMLEKPQITSARVDRPTRTTICLNGSKNLVNGQVTDKTKNIVDLINRHNAFSQKFKK